MQEPPTKGQIAPVGLEVVTVRMLQIIVITILKIDRGLIRGVRSKRDNAGEVIPAAEEIQLNAGQKGKEGQRVNERKGSRDGFSPLVRQIPGKWRGQAYSLF
jgi:hypothetical protein